MPWVRERVDQKWRSLRSLLLSWWPDLRCSIGVHQHVSRLVSLKEAIAEIEDHQAVAPGVFDDGTSTYRDGKRKLNDPSTRLDKPLDGCIGRVHEKVGLGAYRLDLKHDLAIGLGHAEPRSGLGTPVKLVAESVSIESEPAL